MAEYKNPYQQYIVDKKDPLSEYHPTPKKKVISSAGGRSRTQEELPYQYPERASRPEAVNQAGLWRRVKQVWDDCQALGWDEEDTAEALFGIVEELTRTPEGSK
jgi:hypothetical protein